MKIAVFGGSIAAHTTAKALTEKGVEVVCSKSDASILKGCNSCIIAFKPVLSGAVETSLFDEVTRLRVILEGCLADQVKRVVFVSSIATMGLSTEPVDTHDFFVPGTSHKPYFLIPAALEGEIYRYLLGGLSIVPVLVSLAVDGKRDDFGLLEALGRWRILPSGGVDIIDARDVAKGIIQAERMGRSGRRYVLSGRFRTSKELAESLGNGRARVVAAPRFATRALTALARQGHDVDARLAPLLSAIRVNDARARAELGHRPRAIAFEN